VGGGGGGGGAGGGQREKLISDIEVRMEERRGGVFLEAFVALQLSARPHGLDSSGGARGESLEGKGTRLRVVF